MCILLGFLYYNLHDLLRESFKSTHNGNVVFVCPYTSFNEILKGLPLNLVSSYLRHVCQTDFIRLRTDKCSTLLHVLCSADRATRYNLCK